MVLAFLTESYNVLVICCIQSSWFFIATEGEINRQRERERERERERDVRFLIKYCFKKKYLLKW
jgi:hypothetical protein